MAFGRKAVEQKEIVAKNADRFGVDIRDLTSMDILTRGQIYYNQDDLQALKAFKDRLVVVKKDRERVLGKVEEVSRLVKYDYDGKLNSVEITHLTGSNAGKIEWVNATQVVSLPTFGRVFRSLRREQTDYADRVAIVRSAMRVLGSLGAARITRTNGSEETLVDEFRTIGAKKSQGSGEVKTKEQD